MQFKKVMKRLGPVIAVAIAAGLAGCDKANFSFDGKEGVPLADLDLSGDPPSEVVLLGPDSLEIRTGEALAVDVEGEPETVERLRFVRDGDSLAVMRSKGESSGTAFLISLPSFHVFGWMSPLSRWSHAVRIIASFDSASSIV